MKTGKNNARSGNEPKVDKALNAYVGKNLSPKKTAHINSIADTIKSAILKYKQPLQ